MNKSIFIFLFLLSVLSRGWCQIADPGFASYLYKKNSFKDLILLGEMDKSHLNILEADSLNYFTGMAYYNLQELDEGINSLSLVSEESGFFNASRYFASWSELFLGDFASAEALARHAIPLSEEEKELEKMFILSSYLMKRDKANADKLLVSFPGESARYKPQWDRMKIHSERLNGFKPKSMELAGLFSGLLPGSGKVYAGHKGAGISSFLSVGTMAAITIENGVKSGWTSWNTLVSAGIFSVFYIGNIYGSIVGIRVYRERFFDELDRAILLDINIPLRNIYL